MHGSLIQSVLGFLKMETTLLSLLLIQDSAMGGELPHEVKRQGGDLPVCDTKTQHVTRD